jgi:hypothetical protein
MPSKVYHLARSCLRYQLTRRGGRFLAKHSEATSSSSHLKFVLATRLAMAGFMLAAIGVANSDWVERDKQDSLQARPFSATAVRAPAESGGEGLARTRVSTVRPGPETMPASPQVNDRPDPTSATTASREPASSGDRHRLPLWVRAPHRGLRCMANLPGILAFL